MSYLGEKRTNRTTSARVAETTPPHDGPNEATYLSTDRRFDNNLEYYPSNS